MAQSRSDHPHALPFCEPHAALHWQAEMGVDELVPYAPAPMSLPKRAPEEHLKVAMEELSRPAAAARATAPARPALPDSLHAAISQATALAAAATTVEALAEAVAQFDGCALKRTAQRTVFGDGNPASDLLFIGEAPGEEEDRQGVPFCGRSGQLLTRMIAGIDLVRERDYYISNSVFWRPPGNRTPNAEELAVCRPFVERLIQLMRPRMLVLVGGVAVKSVLQQDTSLSKLRQKTIPHLIQGMPNPVSVRVLYHPAYLLRNPAQKSAAWADLLDFRVELERS